MKYWLQSQIKKESDRSHHPVTGPHIWESSEQLYHRHQEMTDF